MKKRSFLLYILIGIWLGFTLYQTAFRRPAEPSFQPVPAQPDTPAAAEEVLYTDAEIRALEHTELFYDSTIVHIFYGEINQKGNGSGYHYDRVADTPGKIVEGTRTEEDRYGVYTARVEVDGVPKTGNKGYSSFFPDDMSPQEVIDAVNQAYENMEKLSGDLYAGICDACFEIDIVIGDDGRIVTAYPVNEE